MKPETIFMAYVTAQRDIVRLLEWKKENEINRYGIKTAVDNLIIRRMRQVEKFTVKIVEKVK